MRRMCARTVATWIALVTWSSCGGSSSGTDDVDDGLRSLSGVVRAADGSGLEGIAVRMDGAPSALTE